MKQKLLLALKTLFASKGFSQKALEGLADILAPNLTEESTPEEINAAIEGLAPVTAVMQAEINRQVNTAKIAKVDDIKPLEPVTPAAPEGETAEQKSLRLILEKLEKQDAVIASMQGEKVTNTRRDQFIKSMDGTSKEYQARELKRFDRIAFKDDDDFTSFLDDTKDDHAAAIQEEANSGLGGERPAGGAGGFTAGLKKEASAAEVDAAIDSII